MKRVALVLVVMTSFAAVAAGCGPEEQWCYDQHMTCKAAAAHEQAKKDQKEKEERDRLADAGISDGGAVVVGQ